MTGSIPRACRHFPFDRDTVGCAACCRHPGKIDFIFAGRGVPGCAHHGTYEMYSPRRPRGITLRVARRLQIGIDRPLNLRGVQRLRYDFQDTAHVIQCAGPAAASPLRIVPSKSSARGISCAVSSFRCPPGANSATFRCFVLKFATGVVEIQLRKSADSSPRPAHHCRILHFFLDRPAWPTAHRPLMRPDSPPQLLQIAARASLGLPLQQYLAQNCSTPSRIADKFHGLF